MKSLYQDQHGMVPKLVLIPHLPSLSLVPRLLLSVSRALCTCQHLCLEHFLHMLPCGSFPHSGQVLDRPLIRKSLLACLAFWEPPLCQPPSTLDWWSTLTHPNFSSFNLPFPSYITYLIDSLFIVRLPKLEPKFQESRSFCLLCFSHHHHLCQLGDVTCDLIQHQPIWVDFS